MLVLLLATGQARAADPWFVRGWACLQGAAPVAEQTPLRINRDPFSGKFYAVFGATPTSPEVLGSALSGADTLDDSGRPSLTFDLHPFSTAQGLRLSGQVQTHLSTPPGQPNAYMSGRLLLNATVSGQVVTREEPLRCAAGEYGPERYDAAGTIQPLRPGLPVRIPLPRPTVPVPRTPAPPVGR